MLFHRRSLHKNKNNKDFNKLVSDLDIHSLEMVCLLTSRTRSNWKLTEYFRILEFAKSFLKVRNINILNCYINFDKRREEIAKFCIE